MNEMTKDQKSLLLYFETCLVDYHGRVEGCRINEADIEIAKQFAESKLIDFGRLSMKAIQKLRGDPHGRIFTHYVRFSDKAWKLAHQFRRERSERMIGKMNSELLAELP